MAQGEAKKYGFSSLLLTARGPGQFAPTQAGEAARAPRHDCEVEHGSDDEAEAQSTGATRARRGGGRGSAGAAKDEEGHCGGWCPGGGWRGSAGAAVDGVLRHNREARWSVGRACCASVLGEEQGPAGLEVWCGCRGGRGRRTSGDRRWSHGGRLGGCGSEDEDSGCVRWRESVRVVKEIRRREKREIVK